ncbi:MAG: ATP-binding cassette domain-containing protein [Nitrospirae bacterium]|nr:ATP-binding cassette domain-containing protein [Nitrospirota bacterium]
MIAFENVDFCYEDGTQVLFDVNLRVPDGTTLALLGASGSGKTTLLHVLLGLLKPTGGRVLVDGQDIVPMREKALSDVRERMGVVFQDGALFDSLTVGENVSFYMRERMRLDEDEMERRTLEQLKYVGLSHTMDLMPDELSGGMRRRVAVARAMAAFRPTIMLYDEPTSGLDPITADSICDLIRQVGTEQKLTSIIVTHRLRDAFKVADRLVLFRAGRIYFEGTCDLLRAATDPYIKRFMA